MAGIKISGDNIQSIIDKVEGAKAAALTAEGITAVELITMRMQTGYGKPIWRTGALQGDVQYEVDGDQVIVGNTLEYAPYVHDGTYKMAGRAYVRDALFNELAQQALGDVLAETLQKAFDPTT